LVLNEPQLDLSLGKWQQIVEEQNLATQMLGTSLTVCLPKVAADLQHALMPRKQRQGAMTV
jgi:hypothetical protein